MGWRVPSDHSIALAVAAGSRPTASGANQANEHVVPRISEFYGIVISMYYNDHAPPHFHARYAEHEAELRIESLEILRGFLPERRLALVREWAAMHTAELSANWESARRGEPLSRIAGLE